MEANVAERIEKTEQRDERTLAVLQHLVSRIDVTDARLRRDYGSSVLRAAEDCVRRGLDRTLPDRTAPWDTPLLGENVLTELGKIKLLTLLRGAAAAQEQQKKQAAEDAELVDKLVSELEQHQLYLTKEIEQLSLLREELEERNLLLGLYREAGRRRLRRERETTLSSKKEIAGRTRLARDADNVRDFESQCRDFEGRLLVLDGESVVCQKFSLLLQQLRELEVSLTGSIHGFLLEAVPAWRQGKTENRPDANRLLNRALEELTQQWEDCAAKAAAAAESLQTLLRRNKEE